MQGNDNQQIIDTLGARLNVAINCPVHYPAWGKRIFECKCGKLFPLYIVEGKTDEELRRIHNA